MGLCSKFTIIYLQKNLCNSRNELFFVLKFEAGYLQMLWNFPHQNL